MSVYEVTTEDGSVYEVTTEDDPVMPQQAEEEEPGFLDSVWTGIKNAPSVAVDTIASIPSGVSNVFNSVFSPVESLENGTLERTARGTGSLAAGLAGAGTGAGFGSVLGPAGTLVGGAAGGAAGLLGFDWLNQLTGADEPTTPEEDVQKLGENIGTGLALSAATGAAKTGLKKLSKAVPEHANALDRSSLGAMKSDYGKAGDTRTVDTPEGSVETYTKQALDDLLENKKLGTSRDPLVLKQLVDEKAGKLRETIGDVVRAYDESGAPPVFPEFPGAINYLYSGKVPADLIDSYMGRLDTLDRVIKEQGKGSLQFLQQQKIAFGKSWDPADKVKSGFDRQIYSDLKNTIEKATPEVGPLNAELQKYEVADPIVTRSLRGAENSSGLKKLRDLTYTTGGIGAPTLAGAVLGGPVGTAVGLGAGLTGRYLASPRGQAALARGLRNTGAVTESVAGAIDKGSIPVVSASQATNDQRTDRKKNRIEGSQRNAGSSLRQRLAPGPVSNLSSFQNSATMFSNQPETNSVIPDLFQGENMEGNQPPVKQEVAMVEQEIDADPYYSALYEAESGRNPMAKNPESTASGGFQFLKSTARAVGLDDPFDLGKSFKAVRTLTDENRERFGDDPELLYSAHYLGATVLNKVLTGAPLTEKEQAQVAYLKEKALPRFLRFYRQKDSAVEV